MESHRKHRKYLITDVHKVFVKVGGYRELSQYFQVTETYLRQKMSAKGRINNLILIMPIPEKYKLYLDDFRHPSDSFQYTGHVLYKEEWLIVRNYDDFCEAIKNLGMPEFISFDHDLADEHYHPDMYDKEKYSKLVFKEKTGYDCAKFLVDFCIENQKELPNFLVHSMNPAGRENILGLLTNFNKVQKEHGNLL